MNSINDDSVATLFKFCPKIKCPKLSIKVKNRWTIFTCNKLNALSLFKVNNINNLILRSAKF